MNNIVEQKWVVIPAVDHHEGLYASTVLLEWVCPVCGKPRGEIIHNTRSYDGRCILYCDGWVNPCGHTDTHSDIREEAIRNGLNFKH